LAAKQTAVIRTDASITGSGWKPLQIQNDLWNLPRKKGLFTKADFIYVAKSDVYRCPAGERAIRRFTTV
jgi:hypothetical protein